jgi:hypothetical protein
MSDVKVVQTIPEDAYKRVKIGDSVEITGFKSRCYSYPDGLNNAPVLNTDQIDLTIKVQDEASSFKFDIRGRENLLKLKEALEFALEIEKE